MTVQQLIFHIAKCVTENRTNNINRELPEKVTLKLPFLPILITIYLCNMQSNILNIVFLVIKLPF